MCMYVCVCASTHMHWCMSTLSNIWKIGGRAWSVTFGAPPPQNKNRSLSLHGTHNNDALRLEVSFDGELLVSFSTTEKKGRRQRKGRKEGGV